MRLPLHHYGDPILKQPTSPVGRFTPEITSLIKDMLETMEKSNGVGLAAPQVGRSERICVIHVPRDAEDEAFAEANAAVEMPLVMVNPDILSKEGNLRRQEGCLSFPGFYVDITRAKTVTFAYTDATGERKTATASGLLARAVQHEVDHLDGTTLPDRMSPAQRLLNARKLKALLETPGR